MSNDWITLSSIPWYAWLAIVAIVCGSISGMVNAWFRHCEPMAMIRQGMHPDSLEAKSSVPEL